MSAAPGDTVVQGGCAAALAALRPELARLDLLVEREVLRVRARYDLSQDELHGLYVSDAHVEAQLRTPAEGADGSGTDRLTEAARTALERLEAADASGGDPWSALAARLCLDRAERDLLLAALAPEIDPRYESLFAYLNNDVTRRWPTAELAGRLFAEGPSERIALRGRMTPESRLVRLGLLELLPARDLPYAQRGFRVARSIADWLVGLAYHDERLLGLARLLDTGPTARFIPPGARALLEAAGRRIGTGPPVPPVVCMASTAAEASLAAQQVFALAAQPVLALDLAALRGAPAPEEIVTSVQRLCALFSFGVLAGPLDALVDPEGRAIEAAAVPLRRLAASVPLLFLTASAHLRWRELLPDDPVTPQPVELRLPELPVGDRAAVWRTALGDAGREVTVESLADRFALGPYAILGAVRRAQDTAALQDTPWDTTANLFAAARAISVEGAAGVIRTIDTAFVWDDLVLSAGVRARLLEVLRAIELRPRVLDQWGFGRLSGTRGAKILLAGASGTGKSMAAAILARSLGLPLHRVEVSTVVSKYIGETEKNLDRAFEAARRANAILFVDEADALFGKRSEVKDAHDRYANVEIAYLLQKMEDHDGVVILATNLANNLDEAFSRRMHFVVDFPLPDLPSRERLWRTMLPAQAPQAADIDFAFLARQFVLSGGDIRNIALDAAYRAAQEDQAIGMRHLLMAVARQYGKRGCLPTAAEFREYAKLLGPETIGDDATPAA
jgi:hypothetical protein